MQQSNFLFAMMLIAYIVFITVKGELASYLALFKGGGTPAPVAGTSSPSTLSQLGNAAQSLANINWSNFGLTTQQNNALGNLLGTTQSTPAPVVQADDGIDALDTASSVLGG